MRQINKTLLLILLLAALATASARSQAQVGLRPATATPPADPCVEDANANGVGDVVDIETTAAQQDCQVYLPIVVAN